MLPWLYPIMLAFAVTSVDNQHFQTSVEEHRTVVNELPHFWSSTGFCPPDPHSNATEYFLGNDMQQNLALIGALPTFGGRRQVRVHWLLDLITIDHKDNVLLFDFTNLDAFVSLLNASSLKPGFELMGNPSNYFTDFNDLTQLTVWRKLITHLANHYIELFGIDEVKSWNFETWNEPDHKDRDGLNFTVESFGKYYQATYEGLFIASEQLTLGGPGERCLPVKNDSLCWTLIDKIMERSQEATKLNSFLSFHEKGDLNDTNAIMQKELQVLEELTKRYGFQNFTMVNNEADPEKIWSKPRDWRADANYAALMVKVVADHIDHYYRNQNTRQNVNFKLLSNDNAFLSYHPNQFTSRTLLARFQMNETSPPHVQFVKKPVYIATGFLGLLGDELIETEFKSSDETVKVIATKFLEGYAVLVLNSINETRVVNGSSRVHLSLNIELKGATNLNWRHSRFAINNTHANPHEIWKKQGSPDYPSNNCFKKMRVATEPLMQVDAQDISSQLNCSTDMCLWSSTFDVGLPGVSLIIVCNDKNKIPSELSGLRAIRVNDREILLTWRPSATRCLKTYEVQFARNNSSDFHLVNHRRLLFASFNFHRVVLTGWYRVQAIDFFDRRSDFSETIFYSNT